MGYNSSFLSPLSAEVAALWVADYLMGGLELPPVKEQRRQIAERLRWMRERTEGKMLPVRRAAGFATSRW